MHIFIRKIQPGKLEVLKNWTSELKNRKEEVLISLKEENVVCEALSFFEINSDCYAVFVEYPNADKEIVPSNKDLAINREHIQILRDTLLPPMPLHQLYEFKTEKEV